MCFLNDVLVPTTFDSSYLRSQVDPKTVLTLGNLVAVKVSTSPLANEEFRSCVLTFCVCEELLDGCVLGADYFAVVIHENHKCLPFPASSD